MRKARPAVVMNLPGVGRLPLSIVVPITDWKPEYVTLAWLVLVAPTREEGMNKNSGADAFQVKLLSYDRFVRKLGEIDEDQVDEIAQAIASCVGFRPPS